LGCSSRILALTTLGDDINKMEIGVDTPELTARVGEKIYRISGNEATRYFGRRSSPLPFSLLHKPQARRGSRFQPLCQPGHGYVCQSFRLKFVSD